MASPQPPDQQARNSALAALATQHLAGLWPRVDWSALGVADTVKTVYAAIVTRYGQAAATLAADGYDRRRAAAGARGRYRATPVDPLPRAVTDRTVESAFKGDNIVTVAEAPATTSEMPVQQRVPARLDASIGRHVLQAGRDTISDNAAADPAKPRYIRVPRGATTCAFCIMLASRELGERFGGYLSADGPKYHNHCDCEAVPVFPGDNIHDLSPNIADYQDMYNKAAADAGTHRDTKAILASMRQLHGLK